jgi:ADP-ribose pyrophosphatase YjhB (NUDIX family)
MARTKPTAFAPYQIGRLNLPKFSREVSVMAWIEDACGNLLMVRQAQGKRLWTLPGGKAKGSEKLDAALKRELMEELGERIRSAFPVAMFDRPRKHNLTILYHVRLMSLKFRPEDAHEIANVSFKPRPPANASPSANYFWDLRKRGGFTLQ